MIKIKKYRNNKFYDSTNSKYINAQLIAELYFCSQGQLEITNEFNEDITDRTLSKILGTLDMNSKEYWFIMNSLLSNYNDLIPSKISV